MVTREETRTISEPFELNAYQTTNDIYSLFDDFHWEATQKKAKRASGRSFGNSSSYSADEKCPVINLTWFDSWAFSTWCGGRLPSEIEWEGACRGTIGQLDDASNPLLFW